MPGRSCASVVLCLAESKRRPEDLPSSQGTLAHICPALRPRLETVARGVWRSGAAPAGIKAKAPAIAIFRGSITRLLCPLPTLEAVLSGDSPRLASGWLPPFSGGVPIPHGVPAKNFRIRLSHCFLSFWVCLGAICRLPA